MGPDGQVRAHRERSNDLPNIDVKQSETLEQGCSPYGSKISYTVFDLAAATFLRHSRSTRRSRKRRARRGAPARRILRDRRLDDRRPRASRTTRASRRSPRTTRARGRPRSRQAIRRTSSTTSPRCTGDHLDDQGGVGRHAGPRHRPLCAARHVAVERHERVERDDPRLLLKANPRSSASSSGRSSISRTLVRTARVS